MGKTMELGVIKSAWFWFGEGNTGARGQKTEIPVSALLLALLGALNKP